MVGSSQGDPPQDTEIREAHVQRDTPSGIGMMRGKQPWAGEAVPAQRPQGGNSSAPCRRLVSGDAQRQHNCLVSFESRPGQPPLGPEDDVYLCIT
jgi:hypothetical protein